MTERPSDEALLAALAAIQARGAIGEQSLEGAIAHAEQFVVALAQVSGRVIDLGSGGGLPGLVIAARRPDLELVLVERRMTRVDLLRRAVAALGVSGAVTVFGGDVRDLPMQGTAAAVTARSFAAPEITAHWAGVLLQPNGVLVVSEPPTDNDTRWPVAVLNAAGLSDLGREQGIRRFVRH
jgi:16S rRNA (guanine527-N7)-methyltransferase